MSFAATQDAKDQVRQAVDIVDLVGAYIPLRRQGRFFVGICPWHDDSRPSLQVNQERQSWKCWVCNIGGDVFSFVMKREGIDFREALTMLAERAGITLPSAGRIRPTQPGSPSDKRTLYAAMEWAERQFHQCLASSPDAEAARGYFASRGISGQSIERFRLGFSPDQWQWLLDRARSTSFSPAVLEAAGLIGTSATGGRHYDRFKGRVIFPIRDVQDRPIAFGGRVLPELAKPDSAKYINSPETRLFSKSDQAYGLNLARDAISQSHQVVVVEGYTDVIMAHQCGLRNVVAVLGTALGTRHIQLLRRYADSILLLLDGDEAGQRRTNEVLELFVASDVDVRILTLPGGLDPCDFLLQRGAEPLRTLLGTAVDAFEHAMAVHTRGIDLLQDTHRANQALEKLLTILAQAPRMGGEAAASNLLRERQVLARLAREFALDESLLRTRISDLRRQTPQTRRTNREAVASDALSLRDLDPHDAELLEILIRHPQLVDTALLELSDAQLACEPSRVIFQAYRSLGELGQEPTFSRILGVLDDPRLKSLLVDLDDRAQNKEEHACQDAASRLRQLIDDMRLRRQASEQRASLTALEQRSMSADEEKDVLQQLFEQKLLEQKITRQGIPAPTDG